MYWHPDRSHHIGTANTEPVPARDLSIIKTTHRTAIGGIPQLSQADK